MAAELPSPPESSLDDVTVFMPVGGRGTRAQEVTGNAPKHLIKLGNGQAVLDIACRGLQRAGFRNFVFCVGYHKDKIKDHIASETWIDTEGVDYNFSEEDEEALIGPERAVLRAIGTLGLEGNGLIVPGDMLLPWKGIAAMSRRHAERGTDITIGVTSHPAAYSAHFGRLVVDHSDRLLWCRDKPATAADTLPGSRNFTSATALAMDTSRFVEICNRLEAQAPIPTGSVDLRDRLLAAAIGSPEFTIEAYDTKGLVIDIGTKDTIQHAKENWAQYV
ncbi:MAG TPA: NDP-sugar synthase [Verrucomicrobiae bacterium]|nr:NDP-sugar synthase [Verrucomicrobiae bacterium]